MSIDLLTLLTAVGVLIVVLASVWIFNAAPPPETPDDPAAHWAQIDDTRGKR